MDHDHDFDDAPELPEPEPSNTPEAITKFNEQVNQQVTILDKKLEAICGTQEYPLSNRVRTTKLEEATDEHIIGIIGETGAGKSALYNALLDEESIVPTSCMQACTAAIIEVSYDRSSVNEYRAIVEFVSRESWHEEVRALFSNTKSSSAAGINKETPEFKIALAKLSAVYPDIDQDSVSKLNVDELIRRPGLDILGTSHSINAQTSDERYGELQKYVETKQKAQASLDPGTIDASETAQDMEYWPLVQRVRIFVKAPVLRTGCVLVDLPGVNDVNPARASIANGYLARCTSIWIVSPITRAVDNKIARHLLGDSFKRQLRRDGILNRVVFVCSKADQLVIHELKGKFPSDRTFAALMQEVKVHRQKFAKYERQVRKGFKESKEALQSTSDQVSSLQAEYDAYVKLLEMAKQGETVHPPISRRAKRTTTAETPLPRKRPRIDEMFSSLGNLPPDSDGEDMIDLESGNLSKEQDMRTNTIEQDISQPAMTATELSAKVESIRELLHDWQKRQKDDENQFAVAKKKTENLERIDSRITEQEWTACYTARNKYVSECLKDDFRRGILDLVQAEREDDDDFDPDEEVLTSMRDLPDLPVFCTASQAFQKLRGRFTDESLSTKLTNVEQTGIPDLMRYCIDIGEKKVVAARAESKDRVNQLLNSVRIWLSRGENVSVTLPRGAQTVQEITERLLKDITETFDKAFVKTESEVDRLSEALTRAAETGERQAAGVVQGWVARYPIGPHHTTYLAILRHSGIFTNPVRSYNWLEELLAPMMRCIALRWNNTLNEAIPAALKGAGDLCVRLIDNYLPRLEQTHEFSVASVPTRLALRSQFELLKSEIEQQIARTCETFSQDHRRAGRIFGEVVASKLNPLFMRLGDDFGDGVVKRTRDELVARMAEIKGQIFGAAAAEFTQTLKTAHGDSRKTAQQSVQKFSDKTRQDCRGVFHKQSSSRSTISEEHEHSIMTVVRRIERLIGDQTGEVNNSVDNPSTDSEHPAGPGTPHIKREPSSEPTRRESPVTRRRRSSMDSSASSYKEESD